MLFIRIVKLDGCGRENGAKIFKSSAKRKKGRRKKDNDKKSLFIVIT